MENLQGNLSFGQAIYLVISQTNIGIQYKVKINIFILVKM